jgi:heavy metal sensor kinase
MRNWWKKRSLRLRLTVWYTAVATGILLGLTPAVYALIEHRLHVEFDRQLRIDSVLVESHLASALGDRPHLGADQMGHVNSGGAAWLEVWSENGQLMLRHWPMPENDIKRPLPAPSQAGELFDTVALENKLPVRMIERPARLGQQAVIIRVFRDESGLHRMLREILIGFALGVPIAALLSALGGFVMAGRTLAPLGAMAEQARRITSESLSQRLPNPNPHDELGQLATVFNQTLERLQNSFDALKRFTSDASHELRTPLTALCTVGEVGLRRSTDPGALRDTISSMLEEAQRLRDLTNSLLLLTRVESDPTRRPRTLVDLEELLGDVRDSLSVLAAEKQQTIELKAEPGLAACADRLVLHQAVMNIVHNAIRYGPSQSNVMMQGYSREGKAVIDIADEGPGIAPEYQQRVFERFFRIDKARSRTEGGAGLGLAIARLSVEQLEGTIELESTVGKGSIFRIVLPAPSSNLKKS